MKLSVLRELEDIETRVSATPESIKLIKRLGFEIFVEEGAGIKSGYYDKDYIEVGAQIVSRSECLKLKDICLVVKMPSEKDISELIERNHSLGRIRATNDFHYAITNSEISIIAVGTPLSKDGSLNLDFVFKVAEEIGISLSQKDQFHTIVIRSTVLPGTNKKVGKI